MPHIRTKQKPHTTTKNRKKSSKNKHAKLTKAEKRKAKVMFESFSSGIEPFANIAKKLKTELEQMDAYDEFCEQHKDENWFVYQSLNKADHKPKPIVTETVTHTGYSSNITIKNDDTDMIYHHVKINAAQHRIAAMHRLQDELMPAKIKQVVKSKIKPFVK